MFVLGQQPGAMNIRIKYIVYRTIELISVSYLIFSLKISNSFRKTLDVLENLGCLAISKVVKQDLFDCPKHVGYSSSQVWAVANALRQES